LKTRVAGKRHLGYQLMRPDCIALLTLFSLIASGSSPSARTDLYIEIEASVAQASGAQTVDVIVGNRGTAVSGDNFDAFLEVEWNGKTVCRSTTNFVTPIAPGESIRALRFELRPGTSAEVQQYTVRASTRFWDRGRAGTQKQVIVALPPGRATCVPLKPVQ
jgi:hypothetical protein